MKKQAKMLLVLCLSVVVFSSGVFSIFTAGAVDDLPVADDSSMAALVADASMLEQGEPEAEDASGLVPDSSEETQVVDEPIETADAAGQQEAEPPLEPGAEEDPEETEVPQAAEVQPEAASAASTPVFLAQIEAIYPVATVTADPTPALIFNSPIAGTIEYTGGWNSPTQEVAQGENQIEFYPMANGYYEGCTITVRDSAGQSATWVNPPFTVNAATIDSNLWNHMRTAGFDYDQNALMNPTEAAWIATHHDMIVTGNVRIEKIYNSLKAANPNVLLIGYISMQVSSEIWMGNWATENGYDPEDMYYHYYYDTEMQLTQNRTITIPGWGGGSATTRKEARAVSMYGGYSPACPISPLFVKAYTAYAVHLLTVDASMGKYIDGLFVDGYAEVITNRYSVQRMVEYRDLYGETTHEIALINNGADMTAMRNYMELYASAITGQDIHIMGNASEADWPNGAAATGLANHYDNTFNEISIEYLTKPIRTRQHDIKALKDLYNNMEDGVLIMANSETAWPTRFRDPNNPDDDWTEETWFNYQQHIFATQYLIAHPNGYFAYHAGSASYYGTTDGSFATSHWHVNYEYDIGKPIVHDGVDYWGVYGTDRFYTFEKGPYTLGQGYAYEILAREYENALVISKFGGDSYPQVGSRRITHQLGGEYRRLLADNTLGPVITEIALGQGEGAILIRINDEVAAPAAPAAPLAAGGGGTGGGEEAEAAEAPASSSSRSSRPNAPQSSSASSSSESRSESMAAPSLAPSAQVTESVQPEPTPQVALMSAKDVKSNQWIIVVVIVAILLLALLLALILRKLLKERKRRRDVYRGDDG